MAKKLLGVVAATAAVFGAWQWHRSGGGGGEDSEAADGGGNKLAYDRIWIDHMPRSETDKVNIFLVLHDEEVGVFQTTSMWTGQYEGFRYEGEGGALRVVYPQTKERERVKLRATKCHDVDDMDYCLDVAGASRGVSHYVSADGWEIGPGTTLADALAQADALAHVHAQR